MVRREVEPVQLLFKEYTWYVRAYCRMREAIRLFKVLRMKRVEVLEEVFEPGQRHREESTMPGTAPENRKVEGMGAAGEPEADRKPHNTMEQNAMDEIVFLIDGKEAYRVYDRFEEDEITVTSRGDFEIRMCCSVDDWVFGLILSFGPSARVLGPDWVRKELEKGYGRWRRFMTSDFSDETYGIHKLARTGAGATNKQSGIIPSSTP